ncbi:MAG TPA: VOC family protein, partial [Actinomycetota bacterium]|nr:VOC family protein [Actinomycetota bacterium]
AWRFYVEGLGWEPKMNVPGEIIFFQVAPGVILGFFEAGHFAADLGDQAAPVGKPGGFTLAHNVGSPEEVNRVLADAKAAGATIVKPGQNASFGGYHGHFADPNGVVWEVAHNPGWRVDGEGTVHLG